jgi:hypothetical protein
LTPAVLAARAATSFATKTAIFVAKLCGSFGGRSADRGWLRRSRSGQHTEIPRQQLIDLGVAMTGDQSLDRGLHVGERLNAIELAGGDERGQASPVLGSFVVACEQ